MSEKEKKAGKQWPMDCIWPKPLALLEGDIWDVDEIDPSTVDEHVLELLDTKEYYDRLVEKGILNKDYHFEQKYIPVDEENEMDYDIWEPERGADFWDDDHFDLEYWNDELNESMNLLKLPYAARENIEQDPVWNIEMAIGYQFINENLLRQAFTRRAFAVEYGLVSQLNHNVHAGCSEELEFIGDSILNIIITKEISNQYSCLDSSCTQAPYQTRFDEGIFSKMKNRFICKEHLSMRAVKLGLDKYILYGTGEEPSDSAQEDMMEALIGAVAIDTNWNMDELERLVDRLIDLQVDCADSFLGKSYYDILNAWHQRNFEELPRYEADGMNGKYHAVLRFKVPKNDKGIRREQLITGVGESRSRAREDAARNAYFFICNHHLWSNLKKCGIIPNLQNAIGQLQELYQKKYIQELPRYSFSQGLLDDSWCCDCYFDSFHTYGSGTSKVKAKKEAAYMGLVRLFESAGQDLEGEEECFTS